MSVFFFFFFFFQVLVAERSLMPRHAVVWTVFVLALLIAVLPTNLTFIVIFIFLVLGFLFVASSYFAAADGHPAVSISLKKAGGVFCFLAGLGGW
jgi:uncharacterized protein